MLRFRFLQTTTLCVTAILACASFAGCGSDQKKPQAKKPGPNAAKNDNDGEKKPVKYTSVLKNPVPPPDLGIDPGKWSQLQPRARSFVLETAMKTRGAELFKSLGVPNVRAIYNPENPTELVRFSVQPPNPRAPLPLPDPALEELIKHKASLKSLDLSNLELSEEQGRRFSEFESLEKLSIHMSKIPATLLESVKSLSQLKSCALLDVRLDDATIESLTIPESVRSLELKFNKRITNASVPALSKLTQLQDLTVAGTGITPKGLQELQTALPNCNIAGGLK